LSPNNKFKTYWLTIFIFILKWRCIHSLSRTTIWGKIRARKKYRNHAWDCTIISKIFYPVINRLEAQLSQLVNIYKNEKTLSYQPLTNLDISNFANLAQESCFKNQDSISSHPFKLDQTLRFENHINILVSYPFSEIELEHNVIQNLNLVFQFHFLTQYWLRYIYLILIIFSSQYWIMCPFIVKLTHLPIRKLASFHFHEIELKEKSDLDPQFCDLV